MMFNILWTFVNHFFQYLFGILGGATAWLITEYIRQRLRRPQLAINIYEPPEDQRENPTLNLKLYNAGMTVVHVLGVEIDAICSGRKPNRHPIILTALIPDTSWPLPNSQVFTERQLLRPGETAEIAYNLTVIRSASFFPENCCNPKFEVRVETLFYSTLKESITHSTCTRIQLVRHFLRRLLHRSWSLNKR